MTVPVISRQRWKRGAMAGRYWGAGSRWRRGRTCGAMGPYAERNRWACPAPSWPALLPLARGLVRGVRAVVESAMQAGLQTRPSPPRGGPITLQLSRHDDPWSVLAPLEPRAEAWRRSLRVPSAVPKDINHIRDH